MIQILISSIITGDKQWGQNFYGNLDGVPLEQRDHAHLGLLQEPGHQADRNEDEPSHS